MAFLTKEEMLAKIHPDERVFPIGSIMTVPAPLSYEEQETGTGEKFLIRSNAPCTYCGETQREEDNKSCFSCGSVEFKDTTIRIPMALPRIKIKRTCTDDIESLVRAMREFDIIEVVVRVIRLYVNIIMRFLGVKIYA